MASDSGTSDDDRRLHRSRLDLLRDGRDFRKIVDPCATMNSACPAENVQYCCHCSGVAQGHSADCYSPEARSPTSRAPSPRRLARGE